MQIKLYSDPEITPHLGKHNKIPTNTDSNILVVCNFIVLNPLHYLFPNKYGIAIQIRIRSL